MRVVHIIKVTSIAGAERHLLILLAGLRAQGIDARLIILVEPDKPMDTMMAEATAHHIPIERLVIRRDYDIRLIWQLRQRLQLLRPDIVHTHLIHADFLGIPAAKLARVPVIIMGRHNDNAFRRHALLRTINATLWRLATAGIVISESLRQFNIRVELAPPAKIHLVRYGIAHNPLITVESLKARRKALRTQLRVPDDTLLIGMACRLMPQKGVTYALQAFALLVRAFPQTHLLIAGDGPLRAELEDETAELNLEGRVHFLGWRDDVPDVMAGLDIFLLSSLWEGFGLVLLEAMSKRLPIVATHVSAIPEIVEHGQTGLLVLPRSIEGIADALRILLADRPLRLHMGMLGEARLESRFSMRRMVDETTQVYEHLINSRTRKPLAARVPVIYKNQP